MIKSHLKTWLLSSLVMATATEVLSANISLRDFTIDRGDTATVTFILYNEGQSPFAYSGWQFDLFLPEGLNVEGVSPAQELKNGGFTLNMTNYGAGVCRMVAFTSGDALASEDLMTVTFRASENVARGEARILMRNAVFSSPEGRDIDLRNSEAVVTFNTFGVAETPTQLLRKGDGTSHTFVCMMPVSNVELEKKGYNFVYGYDSPAGESRAIAETPLRYCHAPSEIYDDATLDFWIFAYYTDPEGVLCVSARRHLDGKTDNDFDPSGYIGKPSKAVSNNVTGVYTLEGKKAGEDLNGLAPGIYVVKTETSTYKLIK